MLKLLSILILFFVTASAMADQNEGAYLDAPYIRPAKELKAREAAFRASGAFTDLAPRSNTEAVINIQTSVKAQEDRGTCSIFSSTALLESLLVSQNKFDKSVDLSEEWLEYVLMRNRTEDGSNSTTNFNTLLTYGTTTEVLYPYIGETWESIYSSPLAEQRCGTLTSSLLKSCLLAHRNPALFNAPDAQLSSPNSPLYDEEFLNARRSARDFARKLTMSFTRGRYLRTFDEAKALLDQGIPVTLDFDFYYGAWNHRKAPELGINRDVTNWHKGIVGYPEFGSKDRSESPKAPAGHSVVAVGYDDNMEVTAQVLMASGQTKSVTYKGVVYFKNSWGTANFGSQFTLNGKVYPGYGMMVYKYVDEFGAFYELPQR